MLQICQRLKWIRNERRDELESVGVLMWIGMVDDGGGDVEDRGVEGGSMLEGDVGGEGIVGVKRCVSCNQELGE